MQRHHRRPITFLIAAAMLFGYSATLGQLPPVRTRPTTSPPSAPPSVRPAAPPTAVPTTAPTTPLRPLTAAPSTPATTTGVIPTSAPDEPVEELKFQNAPMDMVFEKYAELTGRTLLLAPGLPKANITLRSEDKLTVEELLHAMDLVLSMHGVAMLEVGDKFLQVVPIKSARQEAMPIMQEGLRLPLAEDGRLVSQLITLKHIEFGEAKKAIEILKHAAYGQIDAFEHINSLLITDVPATVNRMMQIIEYIDQPVVAREEPHVLPIKYTKASEIKGKLEEIIAESQKEQQAKKSTVPEAATSGPPGVQVPRTLPGVIRYRPPGLDTITESATSTVSDEVIADAERGIIRGKVKIVADDRTNILIIITRPENMKFFEKIVTVLDVETDPDVLIKVIRLEYAEAKVVAGMLNDLIGATSKDDAVATPTVTDGSPGSTALREITKPPSIAKATDTTKSKVGELSKDNIKILSDERTNALIIMASKSDLVAMEEIVKDMDVMLSQVLVEALILEVSLDESLETGVDWLQRSLIAYNNNAKGESKPIASFAGGGGGGGLAQLDPLGLTGSFLQGESGQPGGLTYYTTFFDLNLDLILRMVSTDSRTHILSRPMILTTDNKAATIDVSTKQYFFKGKKYAGDQAGNPIYEDDVEQESVGIVLTLTPRINEKKFVVMEIEQTIENVSGFQEINEQRWPIVTTRKLEASIAVRSGEMIVLGGLAERTESTGESKIPILGDIPILGFPFRSTIVEEGRREVIVFITPSVLDTPEEIDAAAAIKRSAFPSPQPWQVDAVTDPLERVSKQPVDEPRKEERKKRRSLFGRIFGAATAEEEGPAPEQPPVVSRPTEAPMAQPEIPVAVPPAREEEAEPPPIPLPAVVETPVPPVVDPPVPEPVSEAPAADAMEGIDPETLRFIKSQEKRWEGTLEKLDRRVEGELQ